METSARKIILISTFVAGLLALVFLNFWASLLLVFEASGGFVNPGPIGPYERMVERMGNFLIISTIISVTIALFSIFIYPYALWKKKKILARNTWIASWGLLVLSFSITLTFPYIAKMVTQGEETEFLRAYHESNLNNATR